MLKLNALLIVILVSCALSLVTAQYKERLLFVELERLEADTKKLEIEWNQLQIDQTTYSKHALIEAVARRDLHMQATTPTRTHYLPLPVAAASASAVTRAAQGVAK